MCYVFVKKSPVGCDLCVEKSVEVAGRAREPPRAQEALGVVAGTWGRGGGGGVVARASQVLRIKSLSIATQAACLRLSQCPP